MLFFLQFFPELARGKNLEFFNMAQVQKLFIACYKHICPGRNRRSQDGQVVLVLQFDSRNEGRFGQESILLYKTDEVMDQILIHTELEPQNIFKFLQHLL